MDRRQFLTLSAMGLAGLTLPGVGADARDSSRYNVVIMGDTHFDTEPASVYHSCYNEPVEWLNRVQREEFARNGEMWRERCPRLLRRASRLIDERTVMAFQMGDLIQGDCGSGEVHTRMLKDVMDSFKAELGGLPFVTVVGNHDIRGVDALQAYCDYMPERMSQELGRDIRKTTFSFNIGEDAYIVIDFNHPDDAEIDRLLDATRGARYTFIITHGPVMPYDGSSCRWFFHGSDSERHTSARLHFRKEFALRKAIVLCGHTHRTELADWYGDGGRITQMTMNSVWSKPELDRYEVKAQGAAEYGILRNRLASMPDGSEIKDETALFDEYRSGLRRYSLSPAAGSYMLNVTRRGVSVDFYAGDSETLTHRFELR